MLRQPHIVDFTPKNLVVSEEYVNFAPRIV